jgi:FdhE protein
MPYPWTRLVRRAEALAREHPAAREMLTFYGGLLASQAHIYEGVRRGYDRRATGLEDLLAVVVAHRHALLAAIHARAPAPLASAANDLAAAPDHDVLALLVDYWHAPSGDQFFQKALLQPWARGLADEGVPLPARSVPGAAACPACAGRPQVGVLQAGGEADDGAKGLVCADCLGTWTVGRLACPSCGEHDEAKLAYFRAAGLEHVRLEVCDTCRRYLKTVDLTRLGLAEPLVDEIAAAALDVWAAEQGYIRLELNLAGL